MLNELGQVGMVFNSDNYTMHVLQDELVCIKTKSGTGYGAMFGVAGVLAEEGIRRAVSKKPSPEMALEDQLLSVKGSFELPYPSILEVEFYKKLFGKAIKIKYLDPKGKARELKASSRRTRRLLG